MRLGILVPAFLAGLAAIVVPILVHLRQRERRDPIRFPSLMFLRRVPHRTADRRRITHPWLLLLRALAVVALVAAFARPFLHRADDSTPIGTPRRAVIVVLDRSMSMGYRGVWQRALDSARAAVASLGGADESALVLFDEAALVEAPLAAGPDVVIRRLGGVHPTGRGTRIATGLRVARDLARGERARGRSVEVVLISDLQRQGLLGLETLEREGAARLRVVSVADPNPSNARVAEVEVDRRAEGTRTRLAVTARLAAKGQAGRAARATLIVDGRPVGEATVRLLPNGIAAARFEPVWIAEGEAQAMVALEPDDLPADDTLRFSIASASGVPVALLLPSDPGAGAVYLEQALAISRDPPLTVTVRRGGSLPNVDQTRVVVADAGSLGGAAVLSLRGFVQGGGGLLLLGDARTGARPAAADWWPAKLGRLIDRTPDRGGQLAQIDGDHPAFEPFKDALATDFGAARFFRYRELLPDSTAAIVARFDDGRPALVEGRLGAGRVMISALSADPLASDFPLQPVFLPTIQRLVAHLGRIRGQSRWYQVGQTASLPVVAGTVTVRSPDGKDLRLAADSAGRTVTFDDPGIYQVTSPLSTAPIVRFAVNPPVVESDLATAEPGQVLAQLRPAGDSTVAADQPRLSRAEQERSQSWWMLLLGTGLALLLAEAIYAARIQRTVPDGGGAP